MVYRLHGELRFSTAAARNTAVTANPGAVAVTLHGQPALVIDRSDPSAITIQTAFSTLSGAAALAGSSARWHACYHGDNADLCALTGSKVW